MVNTQEALESNFVTTELVKFSPSKKLVILDEGRYDETDFGRRLTLSVEIDGKKKQWRPNKDSIKNLQAFGLDTKNWLGKSVRLQNAFFKGKEIVIGTPNVEVPAVGRYKERDENGWIDVESVNVN